MSIQLRRVSNNKIYVTFVTTRKLLGEEMVQILFIFILIFMS